MDGISIICIVPLWVAMGYGLDTDLTCQDVRLTSGTITTGNACSLRYWTISGTTNAASAGTTTVGLPTGCTGANIVAMYGTFINGSYNFPFNHTMSTVGNTARSCTLFYDGTNINVVNGTGATNAYSCPFTIVIVTIS